MPKQRWSLEDKRTFFGSDLIFQSNFKVVWRHSKDPFCLD